jgi:hypothetical protein
MEGRPSEPDQLNDFRDVSHLYHPSLYLSQVHLVERLVTLRLNAPPDQDHDSALRKVDIISNLPLPEIEGRTKSTAKLWWLFIIPAAPGLVVAAVGFVRYAVGG